MEIKEASPLGAMPLSLDTRVPNTIILAKIGQGKTSLLKAIIEYNLNKVFVVLDTLGVMRELDTLKTVVYISPSQYPQLSKNAIIDYAIRIQIKLRNELKIPVFLMVDEIDQYPYGSANKLEWLINYGRNYGLYWIFTYRRTANATKDFVFNCSNFFIGRHKLDIDLKRITKLADLTEEQITKLPDFHFIVIKDDTPVGIITLDFQSGSFTPTPSTSGREGNRKP